MTAGKTPPLLRQDISASHTKLGALLDDTCFQNGIYKHSDEYGAGTPILRITDFDNHGRLTANSFSRVALSPQERDQYVIHENDIIINRVNSLTHIGKSMLVPFMREYPVFESNMMRIRISEEAPLAPEYLAAVLQAGPARRHFRKVAKPAVAQASINQDDVRAVALVLHPKPVQRRIAKALLTWDRALEGTEQLIAAKERHFAATSHLLLTSRKRLNGFSMKWEQRRADEIFENTSRKGHLNEPLLSVTQERGVIPRDMLEGRVTMPSGETGAFKLVEPGNFVISLRSFQGGLEHSNYRGLVSPAYTVLTELVEIDERFFRHYFKSADFIKRLSVAVIGIRDGKQISFQDFCSIKLPFPSVDEQREIAALLDQAEDEIKLLREYAGALKTQKRGLMQKLLTGKWRLPLPAHAFQETVEC